MSGFAGNDSLGGVFPAERVLRLRLLFLFRLCFADEQGFEGRGMYVPYGKKRPRTEGLRG